MEDGHQFFHQEDTIIKGAIIELFERHSVSESPRIMVEDVAPPRSDTLPLGGMRCTRSSSMRYTELRGHTEEPPVPPWCSTRSSAPPPYTPRCSNGCIMKTEEEERRVRPEKRLEPNVDFDDALQVLGSTQILSNLGWVRFFMELVQILTRSLIRKFLWH
jgi:hypothetical protein